MALLGRAAVAIWSDMADPRAHDAWHSREHLPERVGIPGFLRARRCVAIDGEGPRYFVLYEVENAEVMTSPGYLARLNEPTSWTRDMMNSVRSLSRTLCSVVKSQGVGTGAFVAVTQMTPIAGHEEELRLWITRDLWPTLTQRHEIVGIHLLQRDRATTRPDTLERQLRKQQDGIADWILIVEGYDQAILEELAQETLSAANFSRYGAAGQGVTRVYRLGHLAFHCDLEVHASARQP